jgi:hypothetical protein
MSDLKVHKSYKFNTILLTASNAQGIDIQNQRAARPLQVLGTFEIKRNVSFCVLNQTQVTVITRKLHNSQQRNTTRKLS